MDHALIFLAGVVFGAVGVIVAAIRQRRACPENWDD
jgi:hypothetical protein